MSFNIKSSIQKVLAVLLMFCLLAGSFINSIAFAAGEEAASTDVTSNISLEFNQDKVKAGEKLNLSLKNDNQIEVLTIYVKYNTDAFNCTSVDSNLGSAVVNNVPDESILIFTHASQKGLTPPDNTLMQAVLEPKEGYLGEAEFEIQVLESRRWNTAEKKYEDQPYAVGQAISKINVVADLNKTALNEKIASAEAMYKGNYTTDSKTALKTVIDEAKVVSANEFVTQAEVDAMVTKLTDAMKVPPMVEAVDASALEAAVKTAEGYTDEMLAGYTPTTVEVFNQAYASAQAVLEQALNMAKTDENAQTVAAAAKALNDAVDGLEAIPNKDALNKAVATAEEMLNDASVTYIQAYEDALSSALTEAQAVVSDKNATDAQVKASTEKLNKAITEAKANIAGDKAVLDAAISEYKTNYPEANYTTASYKAMKEAIAKAEALSSKMAVEQVLKSEVDNAVQMMKDATDSLVLRATDAEKADLNKAIERAEKLNKEDYIPAAYESMEQALKQAKTIAENSDVSKTEVDKAYQALESTLKTLEMQKRATEEEKADLKAAIENKLNNKHYTEASYADYSKAYDDAKAVYDNKDVTAAQVNEALTKLKTAESSLITYTTDSKSGIEVTGLPAGKEIKVTDQSKNTEAAAAVNQEIQKNEELKGKDTSLLMIKDIKPGMTDEELAAFNADPNSYAMITIPLDKASQGYSAYKICHLKDDGTIEWITPELVNGGTALQFKANSFSRFAVVGVNKKADTTDTGKTTGATNPGTPSSGGTINPNTGLPYTDSELQKGAMQAMGMLGLFGLAVLVIFRHRKVVQ